MRHIPWASVLISFLFAALAQETPRRPDTEAVFRVGVRLVQIEVRVTDDKGKPITDLRRSEFVLKEEGREQKVEFLHYVRDPGVSAPSSLESETSSSLPVQPLPDGAALDYTWLYVAPEVRTPAEFVRSAESLRSFFEDQLRPGFLVSLGGLPFTDDKDLLLSSLDKMVTEPLGGDSGRSSIVDPMLQEGVDTMFQREIAASLQRQNGILTSFVGFSKAPMTSNGRLDDMASLVSVERIDRQIIFYGRLALFRYQDLIERMATFPGKKIVILLRSGLRIEPGHSDLVDRIAAKALRHRVSFFTIDSRGLEAPVPVEDRRAPLAWTGGRRRNPDLLGRQLAQTEERNGLVTLAKSTGGRSVVDANDMGSTLDAVLEESSNYYVLGYYPIELTETGRFRRIRVSTKRPDTKVRAPRGYFEDKPFETLSPKEKSLDLFRALSEPREDFPIEASVSFFAGPEGRTTLVFSTGVQPSSLADPKGGMSEIEASVLVSIKDRIFDSMPMILEQQLQAKVKPEFLERAATDKTLYVSYSDRLPLSPGNYSFRVAFRDETSGRITTLNRALLVPSFKGESVPSSLLLTRVSRPSEGGGASGSQAIDGNAIPDPLVVPGLTLAPEPNRNFRQGDIIYWVYHLYKATADDFKVAARGMQMGLLRDDQWIPAEQVQASGEPSFDRKRGTIQFSARIYTDNLQPGRYTVLAILPNHEKRKVPDLSEDFVLLAR